MPSEEVQRFRERYAQYIERKEASEGSAVEKIHVDEVASKVAAFYERIRNVIEYQEAHLLRKAAIGRILKRRVFLKEFKKDFAEPLIKELIRSGHLKNDTVPEAKIADVQEILNNLFFLLGQKEVKGDIRGASSEWLVRMFVSRIEEELFPFQEGTFLSSMMYEVIKGRLVFKNVSMKEEDANVQLFVAIQRALFRPDADQLQYSLLRLTYPRWGTMSEAELQDVAKNLTNQRAEINAVIHHPLAPYFSKMCNRQRIVFQLIGDLVFNNIPLDEPFELALESFYEERYKKAKRQLHRIAFLSVISFLISKMLVAVAIEIPLDQYFYHHVSLITTGVNIVFPSLLMLLIVFFTRLPSRRNVTLVEESVKNVVSWDDEQKYTVVVPKKRGIIANGFVYLAYAAVFFAILYYMTKWLVILSFSPASTVIFLLFTSMVIATGVKVNNRAKEMSLEKEKVTFFSFILDLIIVPFMTIGRWTISGLSKFNVLVVIFNFLIELPFQFFIEFLENFRSFIRARKEEIG